MSPDKIKTLYHHIYKTYIPSNLSHCWLKERVSYQQSHVTFDHMVTWCYLTNRKRSFSSSTRFIINKLGRMMTKEDGLSFIRSYNPFFKCSRGRLHDNSKILYLLFHKNYDHKTFKGRGLSWGAPTIWLKVNVLNGKFR